MNKFTVYFKNILTDSEAHAQCDNTENKESLETDAILIARAGNVFECTFRQNDTKLNPFNGSNVCTGELL